MDDQVSHGYSLPQNYQVAPSVGYDTGDEAAVAFNFDFESQSASEGTEAY